MKSTLQKKMVADLQLQGYKERTQKSYLRAVRQLALEQRGKIISAGNSEAVQAGAIGRRRRLKSSRCATTFSTAGIKGQPVHCVIFVESQGRAA